MKGIEELPNGQWVVEGDTHLGVWAKEHGSIITDPYLFQFLKPHLEHVGVVWDIGANIGDHARQYLDWGKTVVAVEPNPLAFKCLKHNCPEAVCMNIAASGSTNTLRFTQLANVGASRITLNGGTLVQAEPMDMFNGLPRPGFVKIDVEGWEVEALTGMEKTLAEWKPILFIEVNRSALEANGHSQEDILAILGRHGYTNLCRYPEGILENEPQFDILAKP